MKPILPKMWGTPAILFLVVACFFLAARAGPPQWQPFDAANSPFLISKSVDDKGPSRYEFRGCAFQPPDEAVVNLAVPVHVKRVFVAAVISSAASAVAAFGDPFAPPRGAAAGAPAVTELLEKIPKLMGFVLESFGEYKAALNSFVKEPTEKRFDYYAYFATELKELYSTPGRGRLQRLREIEGIMTPETLFFTHELAGFPDAIAHPLALVFSALYPVVALHLLDEMRAAGVAAHERLEAGLAIAQKLKQIAEALRTTALDGTLDSMLPMPFTNNPHSLGVFKPRNRQDLVAEYARIADDAARRRSGPAAAKIKRTLLHAIHRSKFKSAAKFPFTNNPIFTHNDERTKVKQSLFKPGRKVGWERATVTIDMSPDTACSVGGHRLCEYFKKDGAECAVAPDGSRPAECAYHCGGASVQRGVNKVMQSLVEKYYLHAATWARAHVVKPTEAVRGIALAAQTELDRAMNA